MSGCRWPNFFGVAVCFFVLPLAGFGQIADRDVHPMNNLLPQPRSLTFAAGQFVLTAQFTVATTAFHNGRLDGAALRAIEQLRRTTGLPLTRQVLSAGGSAGLSIAVERAGEEAQSVDEDESYALQVTAAGITIKAATEVGAMRGLQTLQQLVQADGDRYVLPVVSISDSPRFRWRGLMLDCGRHFEPVAAIKRTLDGMAAVKLNVFHWHLTEDQGFRIESKIFPRLTDEGSDGLFYTQQDAMEVVRYARGLGIRVVPEFEMPGHSTAWLVAYPELASGRSPKTIRREFGVSDYALDPTREETYKFIGQFLGEMAAIFPDPYVHIGGDETESPEWKTDPRIQGFMREHGLKDSTALQAYFNQRVLKILNGYHKHMVGWDEILDPALPTDAVIQSWRGGEALVKAAQQGHQGLLSAGYYLDGMKSAGEHYAVDPLPRGSALTPAQRELVLGGEICMWGEQIDERTVDSRLWPRSAAIAERLWSPETVTDVDDLYRRLAATSIELEGLGLQHLSAEDAGLRELAGTEKIEDLKVFASVLEPASFGERYKQQKTSQETVLDRFVDSVRPDPPSRYEFGHLTANFLKRPVGDGEDARELRAMFELLIRTAPGAQRQIEQSPLLSDVSGRAREVPGLAQAGVEAMQFLATGTYTPVGWKKTKLALIDEAKQPSGIVRFTFIEPLVLLVEAVRER
jgi:hexosaminidase